MRFQCPAYLHIVTDTVSTNPGGEVQGTGGGDEVVAFARMELQLIGKRGEGSETDGENSKILPCYFSDIPIWTFMLSKHEYCAGSISG